MNDRLPPARWLGIAGAVLLGLWGILGGILAGPAWSLWATGVPGLGLAAAFLVLDREAVQRVVLSPPMRVGGNALLFSVAVVAVVALVNVIATRHSWRVDLTANKFYSLSDQTRKTLKGLKRKVKITVFSKTNSPEAGQIKDLLQQYRHLSGQLEVEYVDTDQKPAKAMLYKITNYNTCVFESGAKRKDILPQELFGYQFTGQRPQREFKGEQVITAGLISVASDAQQTVYFLEGHGERSVLDTTDNGVAELKAGLERDNDVVKSLNLLKEGRIPADASLIIAAGPRKGVPAQEQKLIGEWLAKDGRLLLLMEADSTAGLETLLKPWGVKPLNGLAADPRSYYYFAGPLVPIPTYRNHKITDDLRKQAIGVMMPASRGLEVGKPDRGDAVALLETTPEGWLETEWQSKAAPKYDAGKDKRGPIALAVAVTVTPKPVPSSTAAPEAPTLPEPQPKLVVYGNVTWVTNGIRGSSEANFDLFANTVSWLTGSAQSISIRPKQRDERMVLLDNVKSAVMWWTTLIFTPLGVIGFGVWRWWRRRSL